MTRHTAAGLTVLAAATTLLLTGCGSGSSTTGQVSGTPGQATQSVSSTDDAKLKDMQQMVDAAESAAAQADSDATQNN